MMPALQYLRHGKALCGKVFRRFVETFNYHNDFIANLKGDGDLPVSDGLINVDLTDPTHPVIRINKMKLEMMFGLDKLPSCFEYGGTTDEDGNKFYGRPYFMVGSRLCRAQDEDCACGTQPGIDYLDITLDSGKAVAVVNHATDYAQLQARADDKDHAIIPLYEFDQNGKVAADLRTMPLISAWEFST